MKKISSLLFLSVVTSCGLAPAAWAQNPSYVTESVTAIGTGWNGEGIYITLAAGSNGCSSGQVYFLPLTAAQYKETVALAIAARVNGNALTVFYSGCANNNTAGQLVSVTIN